MEKYNIISPYLKRESNLSNIASKTNINLRTLQRWVKIYEMQGLIGLSRKKRGDIGCCRKIKNDIKNAIEGLALKKENMSIATITRIVNEYCIEQKLDKVSYYTIRKVIKKIPDDLKVLAKNGDKVYGDKYEMIIRRTSKYPNQMWQTDHSLLDLLIVDCDNQKKKPWLTVVIDDFSRAIAGFSLFTGDPSSL